jgi:hypothetical protein
MANATVPSMRQITRADIQTGAIVFSAVISHQDVAARYGPKHSDHPPDWDAPGPVELWFFELPWGHKITLEAHTSIAYLNVYLESLEIDAVIDFLDLRSHDVFIDTGKVQLLRNRCPIFTRGIEPCSLYRLDDNGNTALVHRYESRRVADYHRALYEARGHKQVYWVEPDAAR